MLRRACRLSMEFATAKKRHEIGRLLEAYRGAVNFYVRSLWPHPGALDKRTLARLPAERTRLQSMQKDQALRQALAMASSTRRSAKALGVPAQCPHFKGMAVLCHGVTLEPGRGSFDLVVRLSTLRPRERITIPTRQTRVLNTWLSRPGARLVQGCALSEKAIVVWVEFPEPQARESGDVIGIDVGISKLIATSEAQAIGTQWRQISARVPRSSPPRFQRPRDPRHSIVPYPSGPVARRLCPGAVADDRASAPDAKRLSVTWSSITAYPTARSIHIRT
jgi:hypothetical protein